MIQQLQNQIPQFNQLFRSDSSRKEERNEKKESRKRKGKKKGTERKETKERTNEKKERKKERHRERNGKRKEKRKQTKEKKYTLTRPVFSSSLFFSYSHFFRTPKIRKSNNSKLQKLL